MTCATCRWWQQLTAVGQCRRYPPAVASQVRLPTTGPNDWCGEYTPDPDRHPSTIRLVDE